MRPAHWVHYPSFLGLSFHEWKGKIKKRKKTKYKQTRFQCIYCLTTPWLMTPWSLHPSRCRSKVSDRETYGSQDLYWGKEPQAAGLDLLHCPWTQRLVLWLSFKVISSSLYSCILSEFSAFFLILLLFNLFMCDSLNHPVVINSVKSVLQNVHFIIQAWNLFCNPFISLLNCFQSPLGSWPAKIENSHIVSMKGAI